MIRTTIMGRENSKHCRALIVLFDRGYRVAENGSVYRLDDKTVSTRLVNGYYLIGMRARKLGLDARARVHALAAYQKYGEKYFEKGIVARHLDGNSKNNSLNNIEIGTYSDNIMDMTEEARKEKAMKAARSQAKLNDNDVDHIRSSNMTLKQIMEKYNISKTAASYVRSGRTYKNKFENKTP